MPAVVASTDSGHAKLRKRKSRRGDPLQSVMAVLSAVQQWADTNERLARVYISLDGNVFHLRAVSAEGTYDFELTTSVTDLAISLTDSGIDTIASRLPDVTPDEMPAFFDASGAVIIYRR